jgi:DNA transformation protein and related proteins
MATKQSTVDFLTDQMVEAGDIRSRKMFGEYAIYCNDKVVALVCDDQLFVKPTVRGKEIVGLGNEAPPYPGAKPYLRISEDFWDDREWLTKLIAETAAILPAPKPKKKK